MPRKSLRRKAIQLMRHHLRNLYTASVTRQVFGEENFIEDYQLHHQKRVFDQMCSSRYLYRSPYYRKDRNIFDVDDALSYDSKNFNNEEFLNAFRITRESFFLLVETIEGTRAFRQTSKKKPNVLYLFNSWYFYLELVKKAFLVDH